jgi:hypothetical protein
MGDSNKQIIGEDDNNTNEGDASKVSYLIWVHTTYTQ